MRTTYFLILGRGSATRNRVVLTTAVHVAFQTVVTGVVYPRLARVPADEWPTAHAAHTRRITPFVAATYGPLALSCAAAAVDLLHRRRDGDVGGTEDLALVVALVGAAGAAATTAVGPARTHGRLGQGHDPDLVARLLRQDRVRWCWAALGGVGALATLLSRIASR